MDRLYLPRLSQLRAALAQSWPNNHFKLGMLEEWSANKIGPELSFRYFDQCLTKLAQNWADTRFLRIQKMAQFWLEMYS